MELAASLFSYAAEQGDHNALYTYAQLLRTGMSLQRCIWKLLSTALLLGQGVERDLSKAADILTDLSMKGHPYAQVLFKNLQECPLKDLKDLAVSIFVLFALSPVVCFGRDVLQWKWCHPVLPEGLHSLQGICTQN